MVKISTKNLVKIVVLVTLVGLYIYNIVKYFWALPAPSDPLEYLGPASWGTTYGGFWPFLDRLALAVNLRIFVLLFSKAYLAGMIYVGVVNTLLVILAMFWAFKKSGFWAAFFVGLFMNSSYLMLGWATYLYPDQTVALYSLLAFIFFFSNLKERRFLNPALLAGIFTALAVLSKATGVSALIFFLIYLIIKKDWRKLKQFLVGAVIGAVIVVILFCLLYNYQSFFDTVKIFFQKSIKNNLASTYSNFGPGYWHEIVLSIKYFPLIALFILIGAYKNHKTKNLLFFGWLNIILALLLRSWAPSIPSYVYSAYIFVCLGASIYLADIFNHSNDRAIPIRHKFSFVVLALIVIFLIIFGLRLGIKYHSVENYNYSYNYLKPLDIFETTNFAYPDIVKWIYTLTPILLISGLLMAEVWQKRIVIVLLIALISFGASFFNSGLAYQKAKYDRERADFFYQNAPLLNLVTEKTFSVYVDSWNQHPYSDRLLWVYRLFFDKKYQRIFDRQYQAQQLNAEEIDKNIIYINQEGDILSRVKGKTILTDQPDTIYKYYPYAKIVQTLPAPHNKLVVMDVSAPENSKKIIHFQFEEDFQQKGPSFGPLKPSEAEKILTPMRILGLRGDNFQISSRQESEQPFIQIGINKAPILGESPEINFGYIVQPSSKLTSKNQSIFVTFTAVIKQVGSVADQRSVVFVQDRVQGDWEVTRADIKGQDWQEYFVTKKLRPGADPSLAGIAFFPESLNNFLLIKNLKISVWSIVDKK